jgi:AhpD family alkylhydroperoxidase
MARVGTVDPADFPPALARMTGDPTSDDRVRLGALTVWANRPALAIAFLRLQRELEVGTRLSPRLRELLRLRVAFHNQCRSCMAVRSAAAIADGMTEGAVCSLEHPAEAPDLTDAEKTALRYADLMATDHLSIDDDVFADLHEHFSEDEIIDLGVHIGICVGFGRLAMSWDIVDDLPPAFRQARAAPWGATPVLR